MFTIRTKDINSEINLLEKKYLEGVISSGDVVKALCVVAKILRDIRQNQVTDMKSRGVALIEPEKKVITEEE